MDVFKTLKMLYPYISDDHLDYIIEKGKLFFYELLFPADPSIDETSYPITSQRDVDYLVSICEAICGRLGINNEIGYRVNGVSRNFDSAEISIFLQTLRKPYARSIK